MGLQLHSSCLNKHLLIDLRSKVAHLPRHGQQAPHGSER